MTEDLVIAHSGETGWQSDLDPDFRSIFNVIPVPLNERGCPQTVQDRTCLIDCETWTASRLGELRRSLGGARLMPRLLLARSSERVAAVVCNALDLSPIPAKPMLARAVERCNAEASAQLRAAIKEKHRPTGDRGLPPPPDPDVRSQAEAVEALAEAVDEFVVATAVGLPIRRDLAGGIAPLVSRLLPDQDLTGWLDRVSDRYAGLYRHFIHVTLVSVAIGRRLGLAPAEIERLGLAALLHDVGKLRVPHAILYKPGKLRSRERAVMKKHSVDGAAALAGSDVGEDPEIVHAVRHHHEYLDGSGYPDGLTQADIPLLTRIVTVADIFSALVDSRSYRPKRPLDEALSHLDDLVRQGKVDGNVVIALVRCVSSADR